MDIRVKRVVMCSGKIYYELIKHRETKKIDDTAIIRLEVWFNSLL
jgi:2-oxoglutarate dehydrogenase E1 component